MHRRSNRKQTQYPDNLFNDAINLNFSDNFKNVYYDMDRSFSSIPEMMKPIEPNIPNLPNILNFDLKNNVSGQNSGPSRNQNSNQYRSYFENDTTGNNTNKYSDTMQKTNESEKYGIKTLLNTRSKLTYPFEKVETISTETKKKIPDHSNNTDKNEEDKIEQFIKQESLNTNENLIEPEIKTTIELPTTNCQTIKINNINQDIIVKENLSDIESSMNSENNIKKIDIKNDNNNILDMNNQYTMNMTENDKLVSQGVTTLPINEPVVGSVTTEVVGSIDHGLENQDVKILNDKNIVQTDQLPKLDIDMIGTSYKVIGDLPIGSKLKIVNNTHLAEDNSMLTSISRYSSGQGRDKIISFLDHLFNETARNIKEILEDIRNGNNVDTNVSVLTGIVGKIHIFLHRYENMRNVYKTDSSAFARLGIIRDKYYTFILTLYRDMVIPKNLTR